jgi:DNA-binding CsgD family transcriptional regulator
MLVDDDRRFVRVNPAAERMLGVPAARLVGRSIDDFAPPEHREAQRKMWAQLVELGTQEGHFEILRADGSTDVTEYRAVAGFAPGQTLIIERPIATRTVFERGPFAAFAPLELSPREREVLELVSEGLSAPEIAERLYVSADTVRTHLKHAYAKLGAHDRGSAVAEGLRRGLIG